MPKSFVLASFISARTRTKPYKRHPYNFQEKEQPKTLEALLRSATYNSMNSAALACRIANSLRPVGDNLVVRELNPAKTAPKPKEPEWEQQRMTLDQAQKQEKRNG